MNEQDKLVIFGVLDQIFEGKQINEIVWNDLIKVLKYADLDELIVNFQNAKMDLETFQQIYDMNSNQVIVDYLIQNKLQLVKVQIFSLFIHEYVCYKKYNKIGNNDNFEKMKQQMNRKREKKSSVPTEIIQKIQKDVKTIYLHNMTQQKVQLMQTNEICDILSHLGLSQYNPLINKLKFNGLDFIYVLDNISSDKMKNDMNCSPQDIEQIQQLVEIMRVIKVGIDQLTEQKQFLDISIRTEDGQLGSTQNLDSTMQMGDSIQLTNQESISSSTTYLTAQSSNSLQQSQNIILLSPSTIGYKQQLGEDMQLSESEFIQQQSNEQKFNHEFEKVTTPYISKQKNNLIDQSEFLEKMTEAYVKIDIKQINLNNINLQLIILIFTYSEQLEEQRKSKLENSQLKKIIEFPNEEMGSQMGSQVNETNQEVQNQQAQQEMGTSDFLLGGDDSQKNESIGMSQILSQFNAQQPKVSQIKIHITNTIFYQVYDLKKKDEFATSEMFIDPNQNLVRNNSINLMNRQESITFNDTNQDQNGSLLLMPNNKSNSSQNNSSNSPQRSRYSKVSFFMEKHKQIDDISTKISFNPFDFSFPNYMKVKVKSLDGSFEFERIIRMEGAVIGRAEENSIQIQNASISRQHAVILFQNEKFWIKDVGSQSGTFIKLKKCAMKPGLRIQLGIKIELRILEIDMKNDNDGKIKILFEKPQNYGKVAIHLTSGTEFILGRDQEKSNFVLEDPAKTISSKHARFLIEGGQVYLEDCESVNGTWLRLSDKQQISEPYQIQEFQQIRLASLIKLYVNSIIVNTARLI